jgi:hypothetical protein
MPGRGETLVADAAASDARSSLEEFVVDGTLSAAGTAIGCCVAGWTTVTSIVG